MNKAISELGLALHHATEAQRELIEIDPFIKFTIPYEKITKVRQDLLKIVNELYAIKDMYKPRTEVK